MGIWVRSASSLALKFLSPFLKSDFNILTLILELNKMYKLLFDMLI